MKKEGVIFKGRLIPPGGGCYLTQTERFFHGGLEGLSRTLTTNAAEVGVCVEHLNEKDMAKIYRIRKLTPRECFRLMGVKDDDISKIENYPLEKTGAGDFAVPEGMDTKALKKLQISESQQYKMAGNSIVVDVLKGVFTQMFRKDAEALF